MNAPIQLYGPYRSRAQRRMQRALRLAGTCAVVVAIVVGAPMVLGLAYGLWLYR